MDTDVIIVGAGAAGLAAAKELARLGLACTLIEGSHRIGGRASSTEIAPGVWFDMGCAWLVGGATNPFVTIADDLGIRLSKDKSAVFELPNHRFQRNRLPLTPAEREACLRYCDDSFAAILASVKASRDVAIGDVIDVSHEFAPPFMDGVAVGWGLDVDRVSTADFASSEGELGYQAYSGFGNLVAAWGADVAVTLNTRAEKITQTPQGVTVETSKGTINGRAAILTVSTGILASGEIRFVPELPDWKTMAITGLPMGTENKIGLHFDTDVFGSEGRGHYSTWNDDGTAAKIDVSVMGFNKAVIFVGGRSAIALEELGPTAMQDYAVDRVADLFGNDIRKHVDHSITTAWSIDPWTRGSWACAQPGQAHQRANLARPVEDRLFFAGEATASGAQGTCHGAYESGIRAAREAARHLTMVT
ncbi:Amine oxidase [Paracoccaceae bacterium]